LMELLVARGGAVTSRAEILRTVWHTDHEGSNVIEAAVGSLRRKLGPEAQRLETGRGVGSRLRVHLRAHVYAGRPLDGPSRKAVHSGAADDAGRAAEQDRRI